MTDQQQEFLRLYIVRQQSYNAVSEQMNLPRETLLNWYEELEEEREKITKIRNKWARNKILPVFEDYYQWYLDQESKCDYCGITESEIEGLMKKDHIFTKNFPSKGSKLEYHRKEINLENDQIENVVLCCYWCNNAKTDEFSYEEFKSVGKAMSDIWKRRIGK